MHGISKLYTPVLLLLAGLALAGCSELRQLVQTDEPAETPYDVGRQYFDEGRLALAIEQFRLVIAAEPNSVAGLNGLGATYDRMGRYDLSARYYERALRIAPNSPQTLNNLGVSHLMQGRPDLATVYLGEARQQDGADAAIIANHDAAVVAVAEHPPVAERAEAAAADKAEPLPIRRMTAAVQRLFTQVREVAVVPLPLPQPRPARAHVIAPEQLTIDLSMLTPEVETGGDASQSVKGDESPKPYSSLTIEIGGSVGAS